MTPARVLAAGVLWRLFGRRASARTLLEAFAADNEQNRMLAGISLVRAGQRSFDLIENEIQPEISMRVSSLLYRPAQKTNRFVSGLVVMMLTGLIPGRAV